MRTVDMTTPPRPRGRPVTGQAKPAKVRMAEMRQRTFDKLTLTDDPMDDLPASALIDVLHLCYHKGAAGELAAVIESLVIKFNRLPHAQQRLVLSLTGAD